MVCEGTAKDELFWFRENFRVFSFLYNELTGV